MVLLAHRKEIESDIKEALMEAFIRGQQSRDELVRKLAEVLGISRRSVQLVEASRVSPFPGTLRKFLALKAKYEQEKQRDEDARNAREQAAQAAAIAA